MRIKFLLDENIPYALIDLLEKKNFTVEHLKKIGKQGIKNGEVYKIAENKKMWIITRDADFQSLHRFHTYNTGLQYTWRKNRFLTQQFKPVDISLTNLTDASEEFKHILRQNPSLSKSFE